MNQHQGVFRFRMDAQSGVARLQRERVYHEVHEYNVPLPSIRVCVCCVREAQLLDERSVHIVKHVRPYFADS